MFPYRNICFLVSVTGPFCLRLDKNGEVEDAEFQRFVDDIIGWIIANDDYNNSGHYGNENTEDFIVNYLVREGLGEEPFCRMLYRSYKDKDNCGLNLYDMISGNLPIPLNNYTKSPEHIIEQFIKFQNQLQDNLKKEIEKNHNENFNENWDNILKDLNEYENIINFKIIDKDEIFINYNGML
jgi:hypothetical protein